MGGLIRTMHLLCNMCHIKTIETFSGCMYIRSELPQTIAATIAATLSSKLLETDMQQTSWCLRIQWERGFVFPEDDPQKTCQNGWSFTTLPPPPNLSVKLTLLEVKGKRLYFHYESFNWNCEDHFKWVCLHGVCIFIFLNVKFTIMKCVYMCKSFTSLHCFMC